MVCALKRIVVEVHNAAVHDHDLMRISSLFRLDCANNVVITASWCSDSWQYLASNMVSDLTSSLPTFVLQVVIKKGTPVVKVTSVQTICEAMNT